MQWLKLVPKKANEEQIIDIWTALVKMTFVKQLLWVHVETQIQHIQSKHRNAACIQSIILTYSALSRPFCLFFMTFAF